MPAYLVYVCREVSDREKLETYWKVTQETFVGRNMKILSAYTPFKHLEGEGPVEGVVIAEFPSMEEAMEWYDSPGYVAARQHRIAGTDYLGLLVDGGWLPPDQRMPHTKNNGKNAEE